MSTKRIALIEAYQTAVISIGKRGTLKKARSVVAAAERAYGAGDVYTWGTSTKADFLEYCAVRIADLVAHDHSEALEMVLEMQIESDLKAGRPVCEETGRDLREWSGNSIKAAHAEALIINDALDETYPLARKVLAWPYFSDESKARMLELTHAEALEMEKQATHFRKEQAALTQRVAVIMGKGNTPEINTAPV
ncbi:hypothetical protein [Pantoea agglomerans]|uniref:hypothetical protein n=1 Tax=Enterobacter agglomerans TaxID=549 RepID=UPI0018778F8D|nr:hypothetical protein [Pantoea agglomerans]MBE5683918.1 hypothetical protein [Pantoea agglomerans]